MFGLFRRLKRKRLLKKPFPAAWEEWMAKHCRFAEKFDVEQNRRFRDRLKLFVWEKRWIAAGGLDLTDEIKVAIAGEAARISRGLPLEVYDHLSEIVVYPYSYAHPDEFNFEVFGEAHHWGTIVLSWDAVARGLAVPDDGLNTAIHEFAHVLDIENGWFNGTPVLHSGRDYEPWAEVMTKYFERLREDPQYSLLDEYGATDEAEFFAVASEVFFERPRELREWAPDLYEQLQHYYNVDP